MFPLDGYCLAGNDHGPMSSEAFPEIQKIQYEGPSSKNPLSFKHYNADEEVGGKAMKEHMRFSVAYWHAMRNPLADPFGGGTKFTFSKPAAIRFKFFKCLC